MTARSLAPQPKPSADASRRRPAAAALALLLCAGGAAAAGPEIAPLGCPVFHCTPEATGVIHQPLVQAPTTVLSNAALGTLMKQGCSGDGTRLACLFATDKVAAGTAKGTLKVIDAKTLQPIWGGAGVAGSYDIDAGTFSPGQVPVMFADGKVAAGDASQYVLYDAAGKALKSVALDGGGKTMGLTPISAKYGVISQVSGKLTLVDLPTWTKVSELTLSGDGNAVTLVSPSSGSGGVLYAVARNTPRGYLFAVSIGSDARTRVKLVQRATFTFQGSSGASPVVVPPAVTGFAGNLILLHAPGLVGGGAGQHDRLLGLLDGGGPTITMAWPAPITLPQTLEFAPTVDEVSKSLFVQYRTGTTIYRHGLLQGQYVEQYDLRSIGGYPASFLLNGHVLSNQAGGVFTLLLSGATSEPGAPTTGQHVMGFRPLVAPGQLLWAAKIAPVADDLTEAWATGPSSQDGVACPIVVGTTSGITRVCD